MDVVYERCCGLDVHKRTVVACLLVPGPAGPPRKEVRTFGTMTDDLRQLAAWLTAAAVGAVAMESTGVFVRRITARAIPPTGRTGSEGKPVGQRLTQRRKPTGTTACRRRGASSKACRERLCQTRVPR
jgi:hypothetical protein